MIRHIPIGDHDENGDFFFLIDLAGLPEILLTDYPTNDSANQEENIRSNETLEEYKKALLEYFDKSMGFNLLIHSLAHNMLIEEIMKSRLELWESLENSFVGEDKNFNEEVFIKILSTHPELDNYCTIDEKTVFSPYYEYQYDYLYEKIINTLKPLKETPDSFFEMIAARCFAAFSTEELYNKRRIRAIQMLSEETIFNSGIPWDVDITSDRPTQFNPDDIQRILDAIAAAKQETITSVNQGNSNLEKEIAQVEKSSQNILSRLSNPTSRIFDYGIECGAISAPEGEDNRYIINGSLTTALSNWFKFLKKKKNFQQDELPTSSSIKTKLRRATSSKHRSRDEEARIIGDAIDKVKGWVNSND